MSLKSETQQRRDAHPVAGKAVMFDVLKGGYGKSSISVNLADRLAARGNDVLYMDLDPNGHISSILGYNDVYEDGTHDYGYVVSEKGWYQKQSYGPEEMIYETEWGWDFVPSYNDMESFEAALREEQQSVSLIADNFLKPLFEADAYDYCIMDGGGERSRIADSGFYAAQQAIIPLVPGEESVSAWKRTKDRVVDPLKENFPNFNVMAVVPNLLSERIDQNTKDRVLLELLNSAERFEGKIPSFARFTEEEFEQIDNGELNRLPGIRKDSKISDALSEGMPVAHYAPDCKQIKHFDELARIVENGGVEQ